MSFNNSGDDNIRGSINRKRDSRGSLIGNFGLQNDIMTGSSSMFNSDQALDQKDEEIQQLKNRNEIL